MFSLCISSVHYLTNPFFCRWKNKINRINWILIISLVDSTCKHNHVLGPILYLTGNLMRAWKKLLSLLLVEGYLCQLARVHYIIIRQQIWFVFPFKSLFLLRCAAFSRGCYPSPSAKTKWIIFSFGRQRACSRCHKYATMVMAAFEKWWPWTHWIWKKKKKKNPEQCLRRTRQRCFLFKICEIILESCTDVQLRLSENHIWLYSNMGIEKLHMDSHGRLILDDLQCV